MDSVPLTTIAKQLLGEDEVVVSGETNNTRKNKNGFAESEGQTRREMRGQRGTRLLVLTTVLV